MRKLMLTLLVTLFFASLCWGQYRHDYTKASFNLSATCVDGTHNCWKALPSPPSNLIDGTMGTTGYTLYQKSDGTLWNYSPVTHTFTQATAYGSNNHQIAIVDQSTMYRLETNDGGYCGGSGPTYRTQIWNPSTGTWSNLVTSRNDCETKIAAGQDGTLLALGYGNTSGDPIGKWNGTDWSPFGTVQLLQVSVADINNMCGINKNSSGYLQFLTLLSGNFVVFSNQPPGAPTGCVIGKGENDLNYTMMVWNSSGNAYIYNWSTRSWANTQGVVSTLFGRSQNTMYGLGSGTPYHYNTNGVLTTETTTGSFNGCPIQTCPGSVTHTDSAQLTQTGCLSGHCALGQETAAPTFNMNFGSDTVNTGCDAFTVPVGDVPCAIVVAGEDHCNFSNQTLSAPGPDTSCTMTPILNQGFWKQNSHVTVYFDDQYFTAHSMTCVPPYTTACLVYQGISSWSNLTLKNTSYTFGGTVSMNGSCGGVWDGAWMGISGVVNAPCNPSRPYLIVTATAGTQNLSGLVLGSPSHNNQQYAAIEIDQDVLDLGSADDLILSGAHEEGHHHGLGNCGDPAYPDSCSIGASQPMSPILTVMWYQLDPSQPTSPSQCDIEWANIYESYNILFP